MKRIAAILIAVLMLVGLFSACSSDGGKKEIDIAALSAELLAGTAFPDGLEAIDIEAGCYLYGLESGETGPIADAAFYLATGAVADEIAIFKSKSESDAASVKAAVESRVEYLKNSFESYNPGEVSQLENAALKTSGVYVVFVCADDQAAADEVLKAYF